MDQRCAQGNWEESDEAASSETGGLCLAEIKKKKGECVSFLVGGKRKKETRVFLATVEGHYGGAAKD